MTSDRSPDSPSSQRPAPAPTATAATTAPPASGQGVAPAADAPRRLTVGAVLAALPPLLLAVWVVHSQAHVAWFEAVNAWCDAVAPGWLWAALSALGNGWSVGALSSVLLLVAPRLFWAALMTAPFSGVVARGAKLAFDAPRPGGVLPETAFHHVGPLLRTHGMPSGHTLTAFAIAAAVIYSAPPRLLRRGLWLLVAVAALVGLSRIGVGAHWVDDVLAGAGLGWLCGLAAAATLRRVPVGRSRGRRWPALVGPLFAAGALWLEPDPLLLEPIRLVCAALAVGVALWIVLRGTPGGMLGDDAWPRR